VQLAFTDDLWATRQLLTLCVAGLAFELLWQLLQNDCEWHLFKQVLFTDFSCAEDQLATLCDAGSALDP
jgi:type II secretory pathway component PulF